MSILYTFNDNKDESTENPAGTKGFAFVEFAAPTEGLRTYIKTTFLRLGFQCIAKHKQCEIYLYKQGQVHFLVNCESQGHASTFAREHGICASAMGFWVNNSTKAHQYLVRNGAIPYKYPTAYSAPAIHGIGDSLLYCVDGNSLDCFFESEFSYYDGVNINPVGHGLISIDHLTHNVYNGKMDYWCGFYQTLFNFRQIRHFDISGQKTSLVSRALISPCNTIRIPINESNDEKSQITEYLNDYKGEGIQHIALTTKSIVPSIEALSKAGIDFMEVPLTYYDIITERFPESGLNLYKLSRHHILIDGENDGAAKKILLQIFSKNLLGPIFFEIIERQGHEGFGEGNFTALFEAIEREQIARGYLT
jgi:4-hydroxyphenylpyruvate dioxygenase